MERVGRPWFRSLVTVAVMAAVLLAALWLSLASLATDHPNSVELNGILIKQSNGSQPPNVNGNGNGNGNGDGNGHGQGNAYGHCQPEGEYGEDVEEECEEDD